jgi:hypothetical protein
MNVKHRRFYASAPNEDRCWVVLCAQRTNDWQNEIRREPYSLLTGIEKFTGVMKKTMRTQKKNFCRDSIPLLPQRHDVFASSRPTLEPCRVVYREAFGIQGRLGSRYSLGYDAILPATNHRDNHLMYTGWQIDSLVSREIGLRTNQLGGGGGVESLKQREKAAAWLAEL